MYATWLGAKLPVHVMLPGSWSELGTWDTEPYRGVHIYFRWYSSRLSIELTSSAMPSYAQFIHLIYKSRRPSLFVPMASSQWTLRPYEVKRCMHRPQLQNCSSVIHENAFERCGCLVSLVRACTSSRLLLTSLVYIDVCEQSAAQHMNPHKADVRTIQHKGFRTSALCPSRVPFTYEYLRLYLFHSSAKLRSGNSSKLYRAPSLVGALGSVAQRYEGLL